MDEHIRKHRYSNGSLTDNYTHVLLQICFKLDNESSDTNVCTSGVPVFSILHCGCTGVLFIFLHSRFFLSAYFVCVCVCAV